MINCFVLEHRYWLIEKHPNNMISNSRMTRGVESCISIGGGVG